MQLRLVAALLSITGAVECQTNPSPPPDASEQQKVLTDAAEYAKIFEATLSGFECTRTTRHFQDFNNSVAHDTLRGASVSREFASIMGSIFLPRTETEFAWQDWVTLRGKRMHVYGYRVGAFKSSYHIEAPGQSLDLVSAYHGLIFIDSDNHRVYRITLHADEIPLSFPIQDISLALDYDYARIGDADYLLPLQFELRSREGAKVIRSDVGYDNYRKFMVIASGSPDEIEK